MRNLLRGVFQRMEESSTCGVVESSGRPEGQYGVSGAFTGRQSRLDVGPVLVVQELLLGDLSERTGG